jgi:hypothetical protein
MIPNKLRKKLLILGLTLCFAALLIVCRRKKIKPVQTEEIPVEPPEPYEPTSPINTGTLAWCLPIPANALVKYDFHVSEETRYYIDGLVILTGTEPDIDEVADIVGLESKEYAIAQVRGADDLENRLYRYDQGRFRTVWDVVMAVQEVTSRDGIAVWADPDYVLNPIQITGNPWRVEGSPWRVEGSDQQGAIAVTPPDESDFWAQWSLGEQQGCGILAGPLPDSRQGNTGAGTRVVIFDTTPFRYPGSYTFDLGYEKSMELCVSHPQNPSPLADEHNRHDHGLFVAGLVHAVAPDSQIHLIRVLNEDVVGDLFALITALGALRESGSLEDTVINLSLGLSPEGSEPPPEYINLFHLEAEELFGDHSRENVLQYWWQRINPDDEVPADFANSDFQRNLLESLPQLGSTEVIPVFALDHQLSAARDAGAVIVAAAGNDSKPGAVKHAQIPAAWNYIIGVGATNQSKDRSCYSNTGDVYAPGGEGTPGTCVPGEEQCLGPACGYAVISLATVPKGELNFGYGYWAGSSFAAPLVSGLAAQLLEAGETPANIQTTLEDRFQNNSKPGVTNIAP